ncbi:MAG TPA: hypothetical protein VLU46_08575 [Thermoanaerobaculia bacterium]|nr:hypothetical protein [Thermoanaerobaculia bacterium]
MIVVLLASLAGCRGEPVPRDYQNEPPAMTHPPLKQSQTPTAHGMPAAAPEPSSGVEGKNITRQPTSPVPPTPKLKDQRPATQTTAT